MTILSVALDDELRMSFSSLRARQACLVEVEAEGLVGVGESWINYPAWAHRERVATVCEGLAPYILGHDVSDPAAVQRRLTEAVLPIARQWGAPGPVWQAISGVDLALWDLRGKAQGRSVAALLTPSTATRVRAYASGIGPDRVEHWCKVAVSHGLGAAKVKLGFGPEQDRATLRTARSVLGPETRLFADANQAWTLDQACAMAPELAAHDIAWLEEPLAGNAIDELEELAERTGIPLATGENVYGLPALLRYADSRAIATIQPDLAKCGGITVAAAVATRAGATGAALAPHCYGSAVGIAASLQLAGAFPAVGVIELDLRDNPLRTELLATPLRLESGELVIPDGPGLSVELDPAIVDRYRICEEERGRNDI